MSTAPSRKAVVTGGGTGLGLAISTHLAGAGWDVVLVGRRERVLGAAPAAGSSR